MDRHTQAEYIDDLHGCRCCDRVFDTLRERAHHEREAHVMCEWCGHPVKHEWQLTPHVKFTHTEHYVSEKLAAGGQS